MFYVKSNYFKKKTKNEVYHVIFKNISNFKDFWLEIMIYSISIYTF
jgi:hypothetical protein